MQGGDEKDKVSIASAPNPPYPPHWSMGQYSSNRFQSHLRLIHPIHSRMHWRAWLYLPHVSIASAPNPPYPQQRKRLIFLRKFVSIASAPNPPYPQYDYRYLDCEDSRVSIASAPNPPYPPGYGRHAVQLTERVSIASAPNPPYPLSDSSGKHLGLESFNRICA